MLRRPVDLTRKIKDIVQHSQAMPDEAYAPILHFRRTTADIWASLAYIERAVSQRNRYEAVVEKHLGRIYSMILVNLVETFERFLKELAGECIDETAEYIVDDRFDVFAIKGSVLASHFDTGGSLGRSLCEAATWLDCEETNRRFRKLLSEPFQQGGSFFELFPKQPTDDLRRFETLNLIWQIRHTAVHNVGVITRSDAVKLRTWSKEPVEAPRLMSPTRADLIHLNRFLGEMATLCNRRVGERLAKLLDSIIVPTASHKTKADRIASLFRLPLQIGEEVGSVPPD